MFKEHSGSIKHISGILPAHSLHSLLHYLFGTKDDVLNDCCCRFYLLYHACALACHVTAVDVTLLHCLAERTATECKNLLGCDVGSFSILAKFLENGVLSERTGCPKDLPVTIVDISVALMSFSLYVACAVHSVAAMKRVPTCTASAPMSRYGRVSVAWNRMRRPLLSGL